MNLGFSILILDKINWFYKLGFVELEQTLFRGRYLELAETNQPPLCKGRGTTKWWKDCFGRHFRLYKIYSIYDVGNEHCSFLYLDNSYLIVHILSREHNLP